MTNQSSQKHRRISSIGRLQKRGKERHQKKIICSMVESCDKGQRSRNEQSQNGLEENFRQCFCKLWKDQAKNISDLSQGCCRQKYPQSVETVTPEDDARKQAYSTRCFSCSERCCASRRDFLSTSFWYEISKLLTCAAEKDSGWPFAGDWTKLGSSVQAGNKSWKQWEDYSSQRPVF